MRAGDLNQYVTLQAPWRSQNSYGEEAISFVDIGHAWVAIYPQSGREFVSSQERRAETTFKVRMRYRTDVKADWRIKTGSRVMSIISVLNPEFGNESLDVLAVEVI